MVIETARDPLIAARTVHAFFQFFGPFLVYEQRHGNGLENALMSTPVAETVLGQLDQMVEDYRSAGRVSRTDLFWGLLLWGMEKGGGSQSRKRH